MRITKIEEEAYGLSILVGEDYDYFIPKTGFDAVIMVNISDWVHQVMGKTWADIDSLYRIGAILSKYSKDSKVDWLKTFQMVELLRGDEPRKNAVYIEEKLKQYKFVL
ncbi:MAG: hypothetical protein RL308_342 [Bacteroidota bacterium]|jgi:hypothetical protein